MTAIENLSGALTEDAFPGEVVTRAIVRDVDLGAVGTLALITLDNGHDHTKPSTFGPQGLLSLNAALDAVAARAAAGEIAAVGVTGKPFILAAGADLDGAGAAITAPGIDPAVARERAAGIGALGHAVFRRLGELPVPSFCFINGVALGGGLEVALHCTYRTISSGVPMVAFPECFLGLVPGWGGAYLLPRLIGPAPALKLIIENPLNQNKMIGGAEAYSLGIADAMFEPADFLEESLRWAARVLDGSVTVERAPLADAATWDAAVAATRFLTDGKLHGAAPAPYRALDLVAAARTATRDEGFAAEDAGPRRPAPVGRAPGRALRLRPGAEAGQAARRGARPGPGQEGHQGRRRRRRADGRPDRAAVRPPPAGPGRDDRPRPGPGGLRRRLRARRDRQAAGARAALGRRRQPAEGADQRVGEQGRVRRRRLRDRGGVRGARRSSSRCSPRSRRSSARTACWRPTPPRCR